MGKPFVDQSIKVKDVFDSLDINATGRLEFDN